jgi:DNA polymerase III delta subunit
VTGTFTILCGDDDLTVETRAVALLDGSSPERFDLADGDGDRVVEAAVTPDLFNPAGRVLDVRNFDRADPAVAAALARAVTDNTVRIVARCRTLPGRLRAAVGSDAEIVTCDRPKKSEIPRRLRDLAGAAGVVLDPAVLAAVAAHFDGDLRRARTVFEQLAAVGVRRPRLEQVLVLAGSSRAPTPPWVVTDAVETGSLVDVADALARFDGDPFALLGAFRTRIGQWSRTVEVVAGGGSAADVAATVGVPRFVADRMVRVARHLDRGFWFDAGRWLVDAETALRSAAPAGDVLWVLTARLHRRLVDARRGGTGPAR